MDDGHFLEPDCRKLRENEGYQGYSRWPRALFECETVIAKDRRDRRVPISERNPSTLPPFHENVDGDTLEPSLLRRVRVNDRA